MPMGFTLRPKTSKNFSVFKDGVHQNWQNWQNWGLDHPSL
jgi:hypothetical protein